ncbi:CCA tRNA nucleotidyltransferase [Robiginitomaculum antarcticum]|uniref:CCA tRNA nucleotidyltransferase n=1 Tax=Robiginitomaculum antarcticum TaxID=437507 RepID=UPI000381DE0A|nr:CCA tRNA nucleotidyltransferase [Robiginitomaculum antarcticum]
MPALPPDLLSDTGANALFDAFPNGALRYVGGCVRNGLLGEPIKDIDLATPLEPEGVIAALKAAGIRYAETGIDHGTITAVIKGQPYEVTSLRRDVATDGRRAVVAYTKDWAQDAQRRDFTINALYADRSGTLFDPTGQGLTDIKTRTFRFIGEASERIAEDYLRILRYFRFMAWYAPEAKFDSRALAACRAGKPGLKKLSAERVWSEIKRLLSAPRPARAVNIMLQQGILETLLPEASNAQGLSLLTKLESREAIAPDPYLRLMSMSAREPLPMALLTKRMKMSKVESKRLRAWAGDATALAPGMEQRKALAAIYTAGKQVVMDRARLRAAGAEDPLISARWMALSELAQTWEQPKFPLSGKDLKAAGVAPGEAMGRKLKALEALWVRSGFTADKPKLMMALTLLG